MLLMIRRAGQADTEIKPRQHVTLVPYNIYGSSRPIVRVTNSTRM